MRDSIMLALHGFCLRNSTRGRRLLDATSVGGLVNLLLFLGLLCQVPEDVVQDEVAIGLFGKDESLHKALMRLAFVGDLANDLDDNVRVGALRVDIGDADLGIIEIKLLDAVIDGLCRWWSAHTASQRTLCNLPSGPCTPGPCPPQYQKQTGNACCRRAVVALVQDVHAESGRAGKAHRKSIWALAEGSIVLLDKVPADLILGYLRCRSVGAGLGSCWLRDAVVSGCAVGIGCGIVVGHSIVAVLPIAAVNGHSRVGGCHCGWQVTEGEGKGGSVEDLDNATLS
jgi:hypothetical protein